MSLCTGPKLRFYDWRPANILSTRSLRLLKNKVFDVIVFIIAWRYFYTKCWSVSHVQNTPRNVKHRASYNSLHWLTADWASVACVRDHDSSVLESRQAVLRCDANQNKKIHVSFRARDSNHSGGFYSLKQNLAELLILQLLLWAALQHISST